MKIEKMKISEITYKEIQKIKQNNSIAQDEDVINMLIRYYIDPLFHLTEEFKLEMMQLMDKQKEENRVENIQEMIYSMREQIRMDQSNNQDNDSIDVNHDKD